MGEPALGIDFGTSNSTVGLFHNGTTSMIRVEGDHTSVPTCLFFSMEKNGTTLHVGREALQKYRDGYTGRLLRSLKSILGSSLAHDATAIGFQSYKLADVLTLFLVHLREKAERQAGVPVRKVVIGRPVFFVDDNPDADREAQEQLHDVARRAGFGTVVFQYEPIAAALTYERSLEQDQTVLVADMGGGTADFSVIRLGPTRAGQADRSHDIRGNAGVHIGGTDLDRRLSYTHLMPEFGLGGHYRRRSLELPTAPYHALSTWHLVNSLSTDKSLADLSEMARDAARPELVSRLVEVATYRKGYDLLQKVEEAKISLATCSDVIVDFSHSVDGVSVRFSREGFEEAIREQIKTIRRTVSNLLDSPNVAKSAIGTVFFTGGSSAVPALKEAVASLVPTARSVEGDPVAAVGRGLAIHAGTIFGENRDFGFTPGTR